MPMQAERLSRRFSLCLAGLTLALWALAAEAQVYSWRDNAGHWHFADAPPARDVPADAPERRSVDDLPTLNAMQPPKAPPYRQPATRPKATGTVVSSGAGPGEASPDPRCLGLERRLETVQRELRAGYVEPRGNWLRARRRELSAAYRRECR